MRDRVVTASTCETRPMTDHHVIDEDDIEIRPWWQNPVNFVAIAIAALILGSGIGYWAGDSEIGRAHV